MPRLILKLPPKPVPMKETIRAPKPWAGEGFSATAKAVRALQTVSDVVVGKGTKAAIMSLMPGAIFARRLAIKAAARGRPSLSKIYMRGESRKKFPKKWETKAEVKERRKQREYEFFDDADPETPLFTAQGHLTKGSTQLHIEGIVPSQELLQKGLVRRRKKGVSQRLLGPDPALHLLSAQNKLVKGIIGARGIREALKSAKRLDPSVTSLTGYRVTGIHSQATRDWGRSRTISIVKKRKKDVRK